MAAVIGPAWCIALTVVLGMLWPSYDPVRQTQSELGSVGAPHAAVMNVLGFGGLGLAIAAFAALVSARVAPSPWRTLVVAALVVASAGLVLVAAFPCDAGCVDVTGTGQMHGTVSAMAAIGLPVAVALGAGALRDDARFGTAWLATSAVIGVVSLAAGPLIASDGVPAPGLLQRAAMWLPLAWVAATAWRLRR